jgi:addiction module HigA family antidote
LVLVAPDATGYKRLQIKEATILNPIHPGIWIRENVLPRGMSVTDAAKALGVGRQALSSLLNGKAALSADMAIRLERAFGADRADRNQLLRLQSEYEGGKASEQHRAVPVMGYGPSITTVRARHIEGWADRNLEARSQFAALVRRLVTSTASSLSLVDFPAYDNAERPGWDGEVDAGVATPWVPLGKSGWELGCNADPARKADSDFAQRLASVPADVRAETSFVFVTPRNWPKKKEWEQKKAALQQWKSVRALDASDLEQWIEQSLPGQVWMAEKLAIPTEGFRTLEKCWEDWSSSGSPRLTPTIFKTSIADTQATIRQWLDNSPNRPFVVAADSKDEALAFLACAMGDLRKAAVTQSDLPLVFDDVDALRKATQSSFPIIPIVTNEVAERELGSICHRLHCITVRPRNAVDSEAHILLNLLRSDDMVAALQDAGMEEEGARRLAQETGGSPTILRRRLSAIDAIRKPSWANDHKIARTLVPMALVGAWHTSSEADQKIVSQAANRDFGQIEEDLTALLKLDDAPLWSVGTYRGVASKIDVLFAIKDYVVRHDLDRFFELAHLVLSERDPALDLPEDQRWAAGMYRKVRDHSAVIRAGIEESLVLLAVYGNALFQERLGYDVNSAVVILIRKLLTPLTLEKLLSHNRELSTYAEAAPEEFLAILRKDLDSSCPAAFEILKPVEASALGGCPRSGLLWALEALAWNADRLPQVAEILARLSTKAIDDNWQNKPLNSLKSIFRSWLPQTAASVEQRLSALKLINRKYPEVGWQLCVDQFEPYSRVGDFSCRPKWRTDASGHGYSVTNRENSLFISQCVELALDWPSHTENTLGDLVERLQQLSEEHQAKLWERIDEWASKTNDEQAKAKLREKIRRFALTRTSRLKGLSTSTLTRVKAALSSLEPTDVVIRHGWLFADTWIEESRDELEDETYNHEERQLRIKAQRLVALEKIWRDQGFEGLARLLECSGACFDIGVLMKSIVPQKAGAARILLAALKHPAESFRMDAFVSGFLAASEEREVEFLAQEMKKKATAEQIARFSVCLPFKPHSWRLLDAWGEEFAQQYWTTVQNTWSRHDEKDINEIIDRLLAAERPLVAFATAQFDWAHVETSRLKRLLQATATTAPKQADRHRLRQHEVEEAFQELDRRAGVSIEEKANLEFLYIEVLHDAHEYRIPNLERQVSTSPELFAHAVGLTYKRKHPGEDPPEWKIEDPERLKSVATATYHLLRGIRRIPGTNSTGAIDATELIAWIAGVRALCGQHGREEMGDQCIGQLLSRCGPDPDGTWPCRAVCEALEAYPFEHIARGFSIGKYNQRGVVWRGEGGQQERDLAAQYKLWAERRSYEFPFAASILQGIVSSYEREGAYHDSDAKVRRRVGY